jgi:hypothetical protein
VVEDLGIEEMSVDVATGKERHLAQPRGAAEDVSEELDIRAFRTTRREAEGLVLGENPQRHTPFLALAIGGQEKETLG